MEMEIDNRIWPYLQRQLGYSDEQMAGFRQDPRWRKVLASSPAMMSRTVVFVVRESHGCNVGHRPGDRFCFSPVGYMMAHRGPDKVCPYLMPAMTRLMYLVQERIWEGADPLPLFRFAHCDDVGLGCGGWGQVLIETTIEENGAEP
jgi:uncharacterized repeat protein (TIGR04076 family)